MKKLFLFLVPMAMMFAVVSCEPDDVNPPTDPGNTEAPSGPEVPSESDKPSESKPEPEPTTYTLTLADFQGGVVRMNGEILFKDTVLNENTKLHFHFIPDSEHIYAGCNLFTGIAARDSLTITSDITLTPNFEQISRGVYEQTHKICNYNIRYWNGSSDSANKGEIAWPARKDKVFEMIRKHNMDVCGIEEITKQEAPDVVATLTEYEYIGYGRDNGKENLAGGAGEQTGILYKKDRYQKLDQGRFFLSTTPYKASKLSGSSFNRMVTWVRLKDRVYDDEFFFFATHFDHPTTAAGVAVRSLQADVALAAVPLIAGDKPLFFVGDFNCEPTEPAYEKLSRAYADSYVSMGADAQGGYTCNEEQLLSDNCPGCIETGNTYTGLYSSSDKDPKRIDYVLRTADKVDIISYLADNDNMGLTKYPSDHLPIITEMIINTKK